MTVIESCAYEVTFSLTMRTLLTLTLTLAFAGTAVAAPGQEAAPPGPDKGTLQATAAPPPNGEPPPTSPPPNGQPPTSTAPPPNGTAPGGDMSFDLFGSDKKPSPLDKARDEASLAKIERQSRLRRELLKWHLALGIATMGALAATDVIGQLNYMDKFAKGNDTGKYDTAHLVLGIGTGALFTGTGVVALAAPNPYPKPIKLDAALVHKLSMALATAGMAAQLIMGPISRHAREGHLDQRDLALAHLVIGYGTLAFMGAGVLAFVF